MSENKEQNTDQTLTKEQEILKKVKSIEIKTRGLVNELFSGEYHTVFKGRGMNFSEVREYSIGDDVRDIDWNVTARARTPYIKVYEEERELVLMLMVDISGSGDYGSDKQFKREIATEIAAVLAFSAIRNNDKVGLILFSDKIEKYIPPKKGKGHVFVILRELLSFKPSSTGTSLEIALEFFKSVQKKKASAFLISDFFDDDFEKGIQIVAKKHDLIAIKTADKQESKIPHKGFYALQDNETKEDFFLDLSNKQNREILLNQIKVNLEKLDLIFKRNKVDSVEIDINKSYVEPLKAFFRKRTRKIH